MEPKTSSTDEIDLGQLLQLVRRGLNGIFWGILRAFLYLKRNALKLLVVIIIGVAIGVLLNSLVDDRLQTEVIVKPNFESKDYLYVVVDELKSKISTKDSLFFTSIDIDVNSLRNFKIEIEPIEEQVEINKDILEENNKYLELLKNYKDNDFVLDVVKSEILKKSAFTHRITFTHKNPSKGEVYVGKFLNYINANPYFTQLQKVHTKNAQSRITKNLDLIQQIDVLVANFSEGLKNAPNQTNQGMLLESERGTDISSLLSLKSHLIKEIERMQIELAEQRNAVSVINLGLTHPVKKTLISKNIVLIPVLLVGLFLLVSLISYLNRKSIEIQ